MKWNRDNPFVWPVLVLPLHDRFLCIIQKNGERFPYAVIETTLDGHVYDGCGTTTISLKAIDPGLYTCTLLALDGQSLVRGCNEMSAFEIYAR